MRRFAILVLAIFASLPSAGATPSEEDFQALAASLRPVILSALPKPLHEKCENGVIRRRCSSAFAGGACILKSSRHLVTTELAKTRVTALYAPETKCLFGKRLLMWIPRSCQCWLPTIGSLADR